MKYTSITKAFQDLSPNQLYAILRLRSEVFVVEQNCVFLDADNKDRHCYHVMLYLEDQLVAYARLVPAGTSYNEISIGRIVTSTAARGTGAGKILVQTCIDECDRVFGKQPIRIGAQVYATKFYELFDFVTDGELYDEDGIDHIEMIRPL